MNTGVDSSAGDLPDRTGDDMIITLNGEDRKIPAGSTVRDVVALVVGAERAESGAGLAVAVDGSVVPWTQWQDTAVSAGAQVELLTAFVGG